MLEGLALVITAAVSFLAGLHYDQLRKTVAKLQEDVKAKADVKKPEPNKSVFIDPLDPIERARREHDEMMRKINPNV